MVVVYHLSATMDATLIAELGPKPVIVNVTRPPMRRLYAHRGPGGIETIEALDRTARVDGDHYTLRRVCLVGFSEGCQALRAHLFSGAQPWAVVAIDGTHSGWPKPYTPLEIDPWRKAFDRARARPSDFVFVGTHSGLTYVETLPKPYASTKTTLERITGWSLTSAFSDGEPVHRQQGGAHVLSYGIVGREEALKYQRDGDTWKASHIKQAREALPSVLRSFISNDAGTGSGVESADFPREPITRPSKTTTRAATLGERCVQWCLSHEGITEDPIGSNEGELIRQWRAPCERGLGDAAFLLHLGPSNWCSMFQCAAVQAVLAVGEPQPHGYRAGVVEIVADTSHGDDNEVGYTGTWRPIAYVHKTGWTPLTGDLAIWDRRNPSKPESSWWRHVDRVVSFDEASGMFETIGGNENNRVCRRVRTLHDMRLLGFVEYPRTPFERSTSTQLTADEREQIEALNRLFWVEYLDGLSQGLHRS